MGIAIHGSDVRILSHAINWRLNIATQDPSAAALPPKDCFMMRIALNELSAQQRAIQFGYHSIDIAIGDESYCEDGKVQVSKVIYEQLVEILRSFTNECNDVEIISGSSRSELIGLIDRLQSYA